MVVHPADVQDRDGAHLLMRRSRRLFPFIETIFADGGYQGPEVAAAVAKTGTWKIESAMPAPSPPSSASP